jgi:putative aldouronate transport system permease protein
MEAMHAKYLRKSAGSRIFDALNVLFMLFLILVMVYPFYYTLVLSFNEGKDALRGGLYFYPRRPTVESYAWLFRNIDLLRGAFVSVLRVVVGTLSGLFCTALLAYVTIVRHFSGRRFMRLVFIVTMYFSGGLIPVYLLMMRLHLLNTFAVYWVPSLIDAYYMLLIAAYLNNIPDSLFEAGRIDGASEMRIFLQIVIPISVPVLAAVSIYLVVAHWNAWFDNLIYNTTGKWNTMQIYLRRMLLEAEISSKIAYEVGKVKSVKTMTPASVKAAATIIVTLPVLLTYPFLQKYFIGGITLGSVKQ